jgi:ParB-like chromosome segregation protein Spo0J
VSDKTYVQSRDGQVTEVPKSEERKLLESGEYLPATAADKTAADKEARNSTLGAKAKTFAESAAASAIDVAQAPIALPLRANAALWGDEDPLKNIHGRQTVENIAGLLGGAMTDRNPEAYGREYGENARARAETNPGTVTAGNLAGAVLAGGALSGGAGVAGRATASALGGGAAARAAGAFAGGALEGAAYGQGQAGEEAYLHNIPLTGEKLIAAMGWGAVLGGGVSLAAHGAGALLRRGSRGATPIDSPRLPERDPLAGDIQQVNELGVENTDFNRDPASMRDMSTHRGAYEGATPEEVQQIARGEIPTKNSSKPFPPVAVNIESDGQIYLNDGRHRLQAAKEAGANEILARVRRYDADGNIVAEQTSPVSIGALGAAQEAAPGKVSSALREFADERTAKALGARGSTLKKLGRDAGTAEQTMHDMARTVRDVSLDDGTPVFRPFDSQGELAARVAQAKQETGAKLGAFRDEADKVFEAHPEIAPKANDIASRIQREVVDPLETNPLTSARAQAAPIRQVVDDIRELAAPKFEAVPSGAGRKLVQPKTGESPVSVADLTRLRQGIDDQIYQAKRGVNLTQQGAPPNLKDLERARHIIEESIEAASDKAATFFDKPAAQSYKEVKTQYRHLLLASDIAGAAELQNLGNRVLSPSDYGVGIAAGALHGGPSGIAAAIGHHAVREHASAVLAVLADKLANNLDGKIESGLGAFFRESTARARAGVESASGALDSIPAVPLRRITTPAAVEAFQGRSKDLASAYEKRVAELTNANREAGVGARAAVQQAMGGAYEAMPRLTQAATVTASRGAQYLESQVPRGTVAPTAFQPTRKVSPSDLQIREFAQKWAAVANPLSVVDDLRRGTVTHAQIDALKAVYPALYAEVQQKALTKIRELDSQGKRMPFNDRLQLDLFLDLNGAGEPTLAGQFVDRVASLQAAIAQRAAQPKPGDSGGALQKIGATRQSGAQQTLGG